MGPLCQCLQSGNACSGQVIIPRDSVTTEFGGATLHVCGTMPIGKFSEAALTSRSIHIPPSQWPCILVIHSRVKLAVRHSSPALPL